LVVTVSRPQKPCCHPGGCNQLVKSGKCEAHKKADQRRQDSQRPTSSQRLYGSRWRKAREYYLRQNPLCVHCLKENDQITAAIVIDHIIPHRGDQSLFWDQSNWQSLCKRHHDIKTSKEDGGFGNR